MPCSTPWKSLVMSGREGASMMDVDLAGVPPLKGGQRRRVVATEVPSQLRDALVAEAVRRQVSLSDLAGALILEGWNRHREQAGLKR